MLSRTPLTHGNALSLPDISVLKEYARKGVPHIWLVDPLLRTMSVYRPPVLIGIERHSIATDDGSVALTRDEIFTE